MLTKVRWTSCRCEVVVGRMPASDAEQETSLTIDCKLEHLDQADIVMRRSLLDQMRLHKSTFGISFGLNSHPSLQPKPL